MKPERRLLAVLTVTFLALPSTVSARYLDPGAGSILLQGLIASIAAIFATGAVYWRSTKALIRRLTHRKAMARPTDPGDE